VQDPEFDPKFNPYDALITMDQNIKQLIRAHNDLAAKVLEQDQVIATLIRGLEAANRANEKMLTQGLDRLYENFSQQGQH